MAEAMNTRFYFDLQACGHAAVAVFTISLPLWVQVDTFGLYFACGFCALCLLISYSNYRDAQKLGTNQSPWQPPVDASPQEKAAYLSGFLVLGLVAFPVVTLLAVWGLTWPPDSDAKSQFVFFPIAIIYDWFGYWPAVVSTPVVGVITCGGLYWRIRQLRKPPSAPSLVRRSRW